ncbi:CHAP domain-containing protein [Acetobacterium paludosum]|uniref:CHAP domain-containing protein n=1 Tax=Acetobacterium paludosum TaxID=52693 RepID=A0A923KYQ4_9FIRM|nr:GBS Bsp-like repeat-containing protein [Acetobacterium paludosum]MBC3890001.1 CHAP domain-containing protein [Acetobacterium paludosum]
MKKRQLKGFCFGMVLMVTLGMLSVNVLAKENSVAGSSAPNTTTNSGVSEDSNTVNSTDNSKSDSVDNEPAPEVVPANVAEDTTVADVTAEDTASDDGTEERPPVAESFEVLSDNNNAYSFKPRFTAPGTNNPCYYAENIFCQSGYGMPNCTAYAWGRAYELLGSKPNLSSGNANQWWSYNLTGKVYSCGTTPKVGAIACWSGSACGHVAVVEAISGDQVTLSESGWNSFLFRNSSYTIGSENSIYSGGFQGYIYIGDFCNDVTPPSVANIAIKDIDTEGFTVTSDVSDAGSGIDHVTFSVWTDAAGQDDLVSYTGTVSGDTASCRILYSEHNQEKGAYTVNVCAYDKAGYSAAAQTGIVTDVSPPTISDVEITDVSTNGYTIKCRVVDDTGVDQVMFPTWTTAKGQDDIDIPGNSDKLFCGILTGDTATYTVKEADHNNEWGEYETLINATDQYGNSACYTLRVNVKDDWTIIKEEALNSHDYLFFNDAVTGLETKARIEKLSAAAV